MWRVLGGSVVGRAHTARSLPCQDASAWHCTESISCLAIADGAGSRAHSEIGAQAAVAALIDWVSALEETPDLSDLDHAFALAREAVEDSARAQDVPADELACTLAAVVLTEQSVLVAQLGDSLVFVREDERDTYVVQPSERSEYINETRFLTAEDWADALRSVELPSATVDSIALATDGLQFKILTDISASTPYTPFFDDVFSWAISNGAQSEGLLAFIDDLDDQTGDDKTLLLAVRIPPLPPAGHTPQSKHGARSSLHTPAPKEPGEQATTR